MTYKFNKNDNDKINSIIRKKFLNIEDNNIDYTNDLSQLPLLLQELNNRNWGFQYSNKKNGTSGHFASVSFSPSSIQSCIITVESTNKDTFLFAVCDGIAQAADSYQHIYLFNNK